MENFDNFMLHTYSTKRITSGFMIAFGGGYSFASKPQYPELKEFTLSFKGYQYYVGPGGTLDKTTNVDKNNMAALEDFYEAHKLHTTFIYNHPVLGARKVRFKEPLETPKGIPGAGGVLEDFSLVLKEVFT